MSGSLKCIFLPVVLLLAGCAAGLARGLPGYTPPSSQQAEEWIQVGNETGWFVVGGGYDDVPTHPPPPPRQVQVEIPPKHLSEIQAMTGPQLAEWLQEPSFRDVTHVELEPIPNDQALVWLISRPVPGQLGICTVEATRFYRQIDAPSSSNPDPLIQPDGSFGFEGERRYVFPDQGGVCPTSVRFSDTIESTSAQAVLSAFQVMREAQAKIRPDGTSRLPMTCAEESSGSSRPIACQNVAVVVKALPPNLARFAEGQLWQKPIRNSDWSPEAQAQQLKWQKANVAWEIRYLDPSDPLEHHLYAVTLKGLRHPEAIRVERCARFSEIRAWCSK